MNQLGGSIQGKSMELQHSQERASASMKQSVPSNYSPTIHHHMNSVITDAPSDNLKLNEPSFEPQTPNQIAHDHADLEVFLNQ